MTQINYALRLGGGEVDDKKNVAMFFRIDVSFRAVMEHQTSSGETRYYPLFHRAQSMLACSRTRPWCTHCFEEIPISNNEFIDVSVIRYQRVLCRNCFKLFREQPDLNADHDTGIELIGQPPASSRPYRKQRRRP